jgi:hypothetical protein
MNIDTEKLNADGGEGQADNELEVEISNEDLSTADTTAAEEKVADKTLEEEKKKKNRVPADKRIAGLIRKNHEQTERATIAETYAQKLQRELAEERERRSVSDKAALTNFARAADLALRVAKQEHAEALNSGDSDKISEATSKLASASTEKKNVDDYLERVKTTEAAKPESTKTVTEETDQPRRPTRQEVEANMKPETLRWTRETTWFNPESDEFDPEKHRAAVTYAANTLETKFRRAGREDEIGESPEYFKAIDDFIAREFGEDAPDVNDPPARKVPNMAAGRQDNGQVARSAVSNGNGAGKIKINLTPDENDQIRRMMAAGAVTENGKRVTDFKVAQRRFAIQKHKTELADKSKAT